MAVMLAKEKGDKPLKFAVKCRRVGQHAFTSMDVCRRVGAKILEEMGGRGWRVDLENPELTINIEIRDEDAFLYFDIIRGVGGLPLGSQGPVLCLISSGIDSPVAAWLSMRRGCTITLLHLNIQPYSGEETIKKVVELTKILAKWSPAFKVKLLMAPFGEVLKNIIEKCPSKLTCVLCKRMMLRIAEKIALNRRLMGIVTGDSIGEQASQTLRNMAVISEAVRKIPIYRPLTGFDKPETEKLARDIGTYEISSRPDEGCKAAPSRPTVAAKIDEVIEAEKQLDIESLIDSSINRLVELEV